MYNFVYTWFKQSAVYGVHTCGVVVADEAVDSVDLVGLLLDEVERGVEGAVPHGHGAHGTRLQTWTQLDEYTFRTLECCMCELKDDTCR